MGTLKQAIYAGTFDPFTNGHLDILERALKIFDEVTLLVAVPPTKKPFLSENDRVLLLRDIFKNNPKVKVDSWSGLIVDYAKQNGITKMIRGLRPTGDFDSEFQMAAMNRKLYPDLEIVFLTTGEKYYYVSSSLVKEIYKHEGDISEFVPAQVLKKLEDLKES